MSESTQNSSTHQDIHDETYSPEAVKHLIRRSLRWFVFSLGLVGVLAGFLTGASNSPVVATVLPLIFALIGGAGGFSLLKADIHLPTVINQLGIYGKALTVFTIAFTFGLIYGIISRTPSGWKVLIPPGETLSTRYEIPLTEELSVSNNIELLILREQILLLGATIPEQKEILEAANTELVARTNYLDNIDKSEVETRLQEIKELSKVIVTKDFSALDSAVARLSEEKGLIAISSFNLPSIIEMASMNIRYNDSTSSYYVDLIEQGLLEIRTFRQKIDAPYVVGLSNTTLERLLNLESKLHLLKAELTVPTNEWMSEDHIRVISRLIELRANPDASESSMENNSLKLLLPGGP